MIHIDIEKIKIHWKRTKTINVHNKTTFIYYHIDTITNEWNLFYKRVISYIFT